MGCITSFRLVLVYFESSQILLQPKEICICFSQLLIFIPWNVQKRNKTTLLLLHDLHKLRRCASPLQSITIIVAESFDSKFLNLNVSGTKKDVAPKQRYDRFSSIEDDIHATPTFEHAWTTPGLTFIRGS